MQNNGKIKIKLILSGSGAKGAYHYGFIKKMMNNDKYKITKIFSSSIGAINALLLSNNNFGDFWEKYKDIAPKNKINISSKLEKIIRVPKFISKFDISLSHIYQNLDFTHWNNFLHKHVNLWIYSNNNIPFTISVKNEQKTEIYEFDNDLIKKISDNDICKYIKNIIMMSDIYNYYDNSYLELNGSKNEYCPIKSIINDVDINNNDKKNTIYVLLSLQSQENTLNFISEDYNKRGDFIYNNMDHLSYFYRGYDKSKKSLGEKYINFYGYPLFLFHLENEILEDYNKIYLDEFILNCITNGEHHFKIFDEMMGEIL